jgi:hypothetical protein
VIYFFFSKIPANKPPPGSPTWPLWREIPDYRTFASLSQKLHNNYSKQEGPNKEAPSICPKSKALIEADAYL